MGLTELNDRLHSRDLHLDRTRKPDTFRPESAVADTDTLAQFHKTEGWGNESLPSKVELVIPEPVEAIISSDDRARKRRKTLAIIFGGMAALLLVGGILMKLRANIFSQDNITLEFTGPADVAGAELSTFDLEYANTNWMGIENATLVFEYPETFRPEPALGLDIKKSRAELAVGDVASNARVKTKLSGKFYGAKGDEVKIAVTLRYSPNNISSSYEKKAERSVRIVSSPIFFEIDAPFELTSDQEIQYDIRYGNPGDIPFSGLKIKLEYPAGFIFTGATPRSTDQKNVWDIGALPPGAEGTIAVRGRLTGSRDEQKLIEGGIGIIQGDGTFVAYGENQRKTKMVASPFSIRQSVNGATEGDANPGEPLRYDIEYRNDGNVGIRDAIVTVELDSPFLDLGTLQFENDNVKGAYSQSRKSIIWKASDVPSLARVDPGQTGRLAFSVKTYPNPEQGVAGARNPVVRSIAKIDSPDIPAIVGVTKVVASNTLIVKLNTMLSSDLRGYYQDALIPNTGPIPPLVDQETTYTLHLVLANSSNEIKDSRMSVLLPSGIRYTGQTNAPGEKLSFNERTNELVWDMGTFAPGITRQIVFQVGATPDASLVNKEVTLVSKMVFTGKDVFTERDLRLEKAGKTSSIPEDASVPDSGYRVRATP